MAIQIKQWNANKNAISIIRRPLTYALKIKEDYVQKDGGSTILNVKSLFIPQNDPLLKYFLLVNVMMFFYKIS
ncbi:hypothetical protein ACFX5U_14325 [Sphingobacterium sp. SG20118]|uniref:hypothetical protein n=1 Tax=Sphingobacterium TaxID=28453 RepID=UPI000A9E6388|nr:MULTISPECIES: hypothetical protein [Sphingobacterium]MDH5826003.1 hypothetical protein [Sphingobacterium faecium]